MDQELPRNNLKYQAENLDEELFRRLPAGSPFATFMLRYNIARSCGEATPAFERDLLSELPVPFGVFLFCYRLERAKRVRDGRHSFDVN